MIIRIAKQFQPVFLLFLIASISSCGGSGKKETDSAGLDTSSASAQKADLLQAVDSLLEIMPKPSAVPNIIARTGIEYNSALLCAESAIEKANGNASATAFCLGAFGADVAYMTAYDKGKEAMKRFISAKKMADRIGISSAFDVHMMERLETNLTNRDSLIDLTDEYIKKSSEILKSGEQTKDAALVSAGAVLEGMYITSSLIREYPSEGLPKEQVNQVLIPLYKTLFDQEASINNLIHLLGKINGDDESKKLMENLKELSSIYREGNWKEKIASGQGKVTSELFDIKNLDQAIVKVRNSMIPQ
jgi:hypothetical protein